MGCTDQCQGLLSRVTQLGGELWSRGQTPRDISPLGSPCNPPSALPDLQLSGSSRGIEGAAVTLCGRGQATTSSLDMNVPGWVCAQLFIATALISLHLSEASVLSLL